MFEVRICENGHVSISTGDLPPTEDRCYCGNLAMRHIGYTYLNLRFANGNEMDPGQIAEAIEEEEL